MFSGIVEGTARVVAAIADSGGLRLKLDLGNALRAERGDDLEIGDSVSVSGVCLTVVERDGGFASFDAVPETLSKTRLGDLRCGDPVNVERALRIGDRLGGHFVTGHVDGLGSIASIEPSGTERAVEIETPPGLRRYAVDRGSVAVEGVSLTIARRTARGFKVALIPETLRVTTLGAWKPGDRVHLEMDLLGKWVDQLLEHRRLDEAGGAGPALDLSPDAGRGGPAGSP